jgi:hypothetical protein
MERLPLAEDFPCSQLHAEVFRWRKSLKSSAWSQLHGKSLKSFASESLWHGAGCMGRLPPAKDFKDFPCSWLHAEDFRQRKSLAWSWRTAILKLILLIELLLKINFILFLENNYRRTRFNYFFL